jgi:hypothetical protein
LSGKAGGVSGGGTEKGLEPMPPHALRDAFGASLLLLAAAAGHDRLDSAGQRAAEIAADAIAGRGREQDAGIWELGNRAWTHSRLTCAAGLRAAARSCASLPLATHWSGLADVIVADTAKHAVHPSGRWQRSPADSALDAALLQAFVHALMLECAARLGSPWKPE